MNYPKMLYFGNDTYTDSDRIKEDLFSKKLKTTIVSTPEQEAAKREQGYVDLCDLISNPTEEDKPRRGRPPKVKEEVLENVNVGNNTT